MGKQVSDGPRQVEVRGPSRSSAFDLEELPSAALGEGSQRAVSALPQLHGVEQDTGVPVGSQQEGLDPPGTLGRAPVEPRGGHQYF